jgi:hypothetical protein
MLYDSCGTPISRGAQDTFLQIQEAYCRKAFMRSFDHFSLFRSLFPRIYDSRGQLVSSTTVAPIKERDYRIPFTFQGGPCHE